MRSKTLMALVASVVTMLAGPAPAQQATADTVDDGTIAASIKAGLLDHKATSSMQINVESYEGTVQLSGFVESQAEKDAAGKVASNVSGVTKVVNSLAIAPKTSMGTKLDDSLLTGKVKAALMDAHDVKSMQINVETKNGVTQLAGFVPSQAMKERAGQVAAAVSGVKQVENVLVVRSKE
ncbi:MAG TPA: BON domain-containing protein [Steroidobacteraceae bacterium]|nr:BON domain-containing protein [Steroidobacteraceae bacterium]